MEKIHQGDPRPWVSSQDGLLKLRDEQDLTRQEEAGQENVEQGLRTLISG